MVANPTPRYRAVLDALTPHVIASRVRFPGEVCGCVAVVVGVWEGERWDVWAWWCWWGASCRRHIALRGVRTAVQCQAAVAALAQRRCCYPWAACTAVAPLSCMGKGKGKGKLHALHALCRGSMCGGRIPREAHSTVAAPQRMPCAAIVGAPARSLCPVFSPAAPRPPPPSPMQGCLRQAVVLLCSELALCFAERGLPIPPWRTPNALLARWHLQVGDLA